MPGTDYSLTDSYLRVNRCAIRSCLSINIINDDKLEDLEYFTVSLERSFGVNNRFSIENMERNVTIADHDGTYILSLYAYI